MTARALFLSAVLSASVSAQTPQLADAPGVDIARAKCMGCHGAELIVEQRLSRGAWDREIAKMERWGAELAGVEREQLLTYLAVNFGLTPVASHDTASSQGDAIYRAACRSCHEDDLTSQQRLTRRGWERTVDKMVRWGAAVTADQREPLVAYLVSRYGPKE